MTRLASVEGLPTRRVNSLTVLLTLLAVARSIFDGIAHSIPSMEPLAGRWWAALDLSRSQLSCSAQLAARSGNYGANGRASQTFAVPSRLKVTTREPSGLNDAEVTSAVCPLSVRTSAPLRASQTFAVSS